MNAQDLLGTPLLIAAVSAATVTLAAAVAWMTYAIYHATPELLQVQVFKKLPLLQRSVLFMSLGLVVGMILIVILVGDVDLPVAAWAASATVATILFWYGLFGYASVFRVPRVRLQES